MFTMYQPSLFGNVGFGPSTSSAADSRVRTSARQEEARALRAAARVYGERCSGLSAKSDPLGWSLRTCLLSACEALTGFSLRWNELATPAGHWWLVLGRSEPRTNGIESGLWPGIHCPPAHGNGHPAEWGYGKEQRAIVANALWPTPRSCTAMAAGITEEAIEKAVGRFPNLETQIALSLWPTVHGNQGTNGPTGAVTQNWGTPRKTTNGGRGADRGDNRARLEDQAVAATWPTPRSSENENRTTQPAPSHGKTHGKVLAGEVAGQAAPANPSTHGSGPGCLSSMWVLQLMGWPDGWMDFF
jgi:hypothetical protein